jgi:hypothetical protein
MSDDTNASAAPAGNGAPPASAAAPAVNAPAAAPAAGGKWYESLGFDADTVGWMGNRGLTEMDTTEALKNSINGFRNAEKFLGVPKDQLLRMPNFEKADATELGEFWSKLGKPADAKGYELAVPEGVSPDYADHMAAAMHEAHIPKSMAAALVKANEGYIAKMNESAKAAAVEANKSQVENLRKEWGEAFDVQEGAARHAAQELGIQAEQLDALQGVIGFDGTMKLFASIAEKIGEPAFHGGSGGGEGGPMTPVRAQARIKELQGDKEWSAKYLNGNTEARAEWDRLHKIAYPS